MRQAIVTLSPGHDVTVSKARARGLQAPAPALIHPYGRESSRIIVAAAEPL